MFLSPRSSDKGSLARHFTESTHLNLHDSLLKARANHGLLARLLASSPGGSTIRRLEAANALRLGGVLLHQAIPNSMAIGQSDIGLGDIGLDRGRVRVIGLRAVLGKPGHGGGVGADGERAERGQGREATTAGHHGGRIESCRRGGDVGGGGQTGMRFKGRRFPKELNNPRGVVWWILTASPLRVGARAAGRFFCRWIFGTDDFWNCW